MIFGIYLNCITDSAKFFEILGICFLISSVFLQAGEASSALSTSISPSPYYYKHWCAQETLEFLDDNRCVKLFPSTFDRNFNCKDETKVYDIAPEGYHRDQNLSEISLPAFTLLLW